MRPLTFFLFILLINVAALAQSAGTSSAAEMKKLDFLLGEWKGEGWIEMGPGGRKSFRQTESVRSKLNDTVIIIEGLGKGKIASSGEEVTVHNALAIISYDSGAKRYLLRAFRADGNYIDADVTAGANSLVWGFREPQRNIEIRYTIKLSDAGQWIEVGEFSMDAKNWRKFFEMTLERTRPN